LIQRLISALLGLLLLSSGYAAESLKISAPWVAQAPPGASVMAGYMHIQNLTAEPVEITAIHSPAYERVEMHLSLNQNGVAKMLPQKSLKIPARGSLSLEPGSYHLMMIKPRRALKKGDSVPLSITLSSQQTLQIQLTVKKKPPAGAGSMKCGGGKCGGGK